MCVCVCVLTSFDHAAHPGVGRDVAGNTAAHYAVQGISGLGEDRRVVVVTVDKKLLWLL
jgi:hypothetical protein